MPQIEFEINPETGEMTVDIHGVVGPACDNIQKIIDAAAGAPALSSKKPSYYEHVRPDNRVRGH